MARLNLTLDADTLRALEHHAKEHHSSTAAAARELLRDALARIKAREQRQRLAADYAAGRVDGRGLLAAMESTQLDVLEDEDA